MNFKSTLSDLIPRVPCWIKTIWATFKSFIYTGKLLPYISGHTYSANNTKVYRNVVLVVSECEDCGKKEISWFYEGSWTEEEIKLFHGTNQFTIANRDESQVSLRDMCKF
jgi:hypothetical protein